MSTNTRTATDTGSDGDSGTDTDPVIPDRGTEADGPAAALHDAGRALRRAAFTVIIGASGSGASPSPHGAAGAGSDGGSETAGPAAA